MRIPIERDVTSHLAAMARGEYTSLALTQAYLARIGERDATLGAFLTLCTDAALEAARASDARRAAGDPPRPLEGIPFAVKDNFCTRGVRTTCASRMLEHFVPPYDATALRLLQDAGAILLGKLNLDEFAMGSTTETSALGVTLHPTDPTRVPGGSSGGSAAAVAACEVPFALGSDTGGSVRQPAAFCGVVGFKPTRGLFSRYGMISLASSLDAVGLLCRSVADVRLLTGVLGKPDPMDATSVAPSPEQKKHRPRTVGVIRELMEDGALSPDVRRATLQAAKRLADAGFAIRSVSLPSPDAALAAYAVLCSAEASSNLGRYDGIRYGYRADAETPEELYAKSRAEGFGEEVKRRILFGNYMLTEEKRPLYYDRACRAREAISRQMREILAECDLLLSPTAPTEALVRGSAPADAERRRADLCVVYASLAGLPAISIPAPREEGGLPIGVQLTAAPFDEEGLFWGAERLWEVRE